MNIRSTGTVIDSKKITGRLTVPALTSSSAGHAWRARARASSGAAAATCSSRTRRSCAAGHRDDRAHAGRLTARRVEASNCENVFGAQGNVTRRRLLPPRSDPRVADRATLTRIPFRPRWRENHHPPQPDPRRLTSAQLELRELRDHDRWRRLQASSSRTTCWRAVGSRSAARGPAATRTTRIMNNGFSTVHYYRVGGFGPVNGCLPGDSWPDATEFTGNAILETGLRVP